MQERAARTRRALARAAAHEFDRHGYEGSSLAQIARSAGISLGALTFHFSDKRGLADAVRREAHAETLPAVDRATSREPDPVGSVVLLTLALAELLEDEVAVRAAARLSREQPGCSMDWESSWTPTLHDCLPDTPDGEAGPGPDRTALALLATHLVMGAEVEIRRRVIQEEDLAGQARARLARIWTTVLQGRLVRADAEGDG
ncbi:MULTISPECIES: TetR family transcriptional regulator [Streptomyces]